MSAHAAVIPRPAFAGNVDGAEPPSPAPRRDGPIRLLHHMARSGGTLISKCLGCMRGIVLLSEIHPLGLRQFNPIAQARQWFGLVSDEDLAGLARRGRIELNDALALILERVGERGWHLVVRDWTHLDFTGVPFVAHPAYRLTTAAVLARRFELVQLCTVRHPLDQWLSLCRLPIMQGKLFLEPFLLGYRRFAEAAAEIGFVRYEDVTRAPLPTVEALCRRLEVPFDPEFVENWHGYDRITGDVGGTRGGGELRPVPRRPVAPELLAAFARNPEYRAALDLLGYRHPD